jgi:hypothetical protein
MIKFLKNQDIQITNFAAAKTKAADNLFLDLILATDDKYEFPLILPVEETNLNFNSKNLTGSFSRLYDQCDLNYINNDGYLAAYPSTDDNNPDFQIGKKYPTDFVFYPQTSIYYDSTQNPVNLDSTYQGQVYNTIKNMYYNDYNNAYNQFGIDGFNTSNVKLNLQDTFVTYTLTVPQSGDRVRPFSININNQTGDIVTYIKDDGKNNLYLSGSFFINCFESFTNNTENIVNQCNSGLGKYLCTGIYDCTVLI